MLFPPSLGHIGASARADLLEQWFSRHLDVEVRIKVAPTYEALRTSIADGEVDLAWAPPIVCASVQRSCRMILKAVRGGRSMYRSALVVRGGEVKTLGELQGLRAAWVDPLSTAGYLLPIAHLREQGHPPSTLLSAQDHLGSYGQVLRAVVEGEADLCAVYVHDATDESAESSITELIGGLRGLEALSFTAEAPSDGLAIVERSRDSEIHRLLEPLRTLGRGGTNTMLLTIFDAEGLEPASAGDYAALRKALLPFP